MLRLESLLARASKKSNLKRAKRTRLCLEQLEERVLLSTASERLVQSAFQDLFGRSPDGPSLSIWSGLLDNGIAVDAHLRASDPDIFAAGDCCSFPAALYGGRRVRLEAWRNAQDQGRHAAINMLGGAETYAAVPWFWSDQYDMHLQIAGLGDTWVVPAATL